MLEIIKKPELPQKTYFLVLIEQGKEKEREPVKKRPEETDSDFIIRMSIEASEFNNEKENFKNGLSKMLVTGNTPQV